METEQQETIRARFVKRRTWNIVILTVLVAIAVLIVVMGFVNNGITIGPLSNQVSRYIVAGFGILLFFVHSFVWSCPSCNRYLGRNLNPAVCPKCGTVLREKRGKTG